MAKTKRLPNRRVIFTVLIAVVVLVIVGVGVGDEKTNSVANVLLKNARVAVESVFPDADGDGLSDWKERLFGTNPNNPDSDRDGVSDGVQYASEKTLPNKEVSDSALNYLGATSEALLNGGSLPITGLPEPRFAVKEDLYSRKSLEVVVSTQESRNNYVSSLIVILVGVYPELFEDDMFETISRWVETKGEIELEKIKKREETLRFAAANLSLLSTPVDAVPVHLSIINNLYKESLSLNEIMAVTIENPAQGLLASAQYADYRSKRAKSIAELGNYFNTTKY